MADGARYRCEIISQLRRLRKARGLTQAQLAEKIGYDIKTLACWERGVTAPDSHRLGDGEFYPCKPDIFELTYEQV